MGLIKNINWKYILILASVPSLFFIYTILVLFLTWPISEYSINKSGVFGDSFGVLTAFFSGLAFAGMIVTILLQKDELELQRREISKNRVEFKKTAQAQERAAKLSAASSLLEEYKYRININEEALKKMISGGPAQNLRNEISEIMGKRDKIIKRMEKIINEGRM